MPACIHIHRGGGETRGLRRGGRRFPSLIIMILGVGGGFARGTKAIGILLISFSLLYVCERGFQGLIYVFLG